MNGSVESIWSNKKKHGKKTGKHGDEYLYDVRFPGIGTSTNFRRELSKVFKAVKNEFQCVYIVTLSNAKKSVQTCHMQVSASVVPSQLSQFFVSKLETFMGKITYRTLLLLPPSEPPATWSSSLTIEWVRDTLQTPPLRVVILEFLF